MHKISIINDEISQDINDVIKFCKNNNLDVIELRSINGKNLIDHDFTFLKKIAKKLLANNIDVISIASPILKWKNEKKHTITKDVRMHNFSGKSTNYEKVFEISKVFNAKYIRIFSYLKYDNFKIDDLDKDFEQLISLAKEYKVKLLLENEPVCNIDTIDKLEKVIKRFNNPYLKILLDIGNLYEMDFSVSKLDISKIVDSIEYLHIKDFSTKEKIYKILGEGDINYKKHISDLLELSSKKNFVFSLETHTKENKYKNSEQSYINLKKIIKTKKNIKYGIIGCGRVFAKHAKSIKYTENAFLDGVYDIDKVKSKSAAKEFDCSFFSDLNELITNVDVVNICTPHNTHVGLITSVLKANKKCLCEKPVVLNDKEYKTIIKIKNSKKNLFVVYQNRFNQAIQKIDELIKKNALGKPLYIFGNVRWFRPIDYYKNNWQGTIKKEGGILFNQGIHLIDILMRFGKISNHKNIKIKDAVKRKIYHKKIETEDMFVSHFEANKILFNLEVTVSSIPENLESSIFIIFEKGSILVSGDALNELKFVKTPYFSTDSFVENIRDVYGNGHRKLVESLTNYLLNNTVDDKLTHFEEAYQRVAFINKLYEHEKTNR